MKKSYSNLLLVVMVLLLGNSVGFAQCLSLTTINASLTTTDGNANARLDRNGTISSCNTPKSCNIIESGTFPYRTHTFTNPTATAQCISVTLSSPCASETNRNLQSNAYLNSFDPTNICTNFLADPGQSLGAGSNYGPRTFSFTVPANSTFVIVVMEVNPTIYTCYDYTLEILLPTSLPAGSSSLVVSGPVSCGNAVQVTGTGSGGNSYVFTGPNGYVFSDVFRNNGTYQLVADAIVEPGIYTLNTYNGGCQTAINTVTVNGSGCANTSQSKAGTQSANPNNSSRDF